MASTDVTPYEMSEFPNISDADFEALRAGQVPSDDERLGEVAAFLRDFGEVHPEPSTESLEQAHIASMMATAHLMADNGDPAVMSASKAHGPGIQVSGLPKPRRETMYDRLKAAPIAVKIGTATTAFVLAFTGIAFAGALPAPVQDAVADALAVTGADLPGGSDEAAAEAAEAAAEAAEAAQDAIVDADAALDAEEETADAVEGPEAAETDSAETDDADDAEEAVDVDDDEDGEIRASTHESRDEDRVEPQVAPGEEPKTSESNDQSRDQKETDHSADAGEESDD